MIETKMNERWPDFFIVGTPRSGTTSLYSYLNTVEEIFMSPIKEPHYFSIKSLPYKPPHFKPIRNKKQYLSLFEKAGNRLVGEASSSYLYDSEAPKLIQQVVPTAKIIIIIRDPIERAFSHYVWRVRMRIYNTSFDEQIQKELSTEEIYPTDIVKIGLYSQSIKRYLEFFSREQLKIIIFEEYVKDTKATLEQVLNFLDIEGNIRDVTKEAINRYKGKIIPRGFVSKFFLNNNSVKKIARITFPLGSRKFIENKILLTKSKKPKIEKKDRKFLKKFYRDDVIKLQTIIERKLPWRNFKN